MRTRKARAIGTVVAAVLVVAIQSSWEYAAAQSCIPSLLMPAADAELDNGSTDRSDGIIWDFDWSNCPGATEYQLHVQQVSANNPAINAIVDSSAYHYDCLGCYIAASNRFNWRWRVRAKVNNRWGAWSQMRTFSVERADGDAGPQVFTSLAVWQSAVGQATIQVENFSKSPLGILPAGITDVGAFNVFVDTAEAPAPIYHTRIEDFFGNIRFVGSIFPPGPYPGVREMRFEFDAPIIGFSGDWGETIDDDQLTITINGVKFNFSDLLLPGPPGQNGNGFLGFLDVARPFSSVVIGINSASAISNGETFWLDNVRLVAGNPGLERLLTVSKSGRGDGTVISNPAGINCGTDCSESFAVGTAVTLIATHGGSSTFVGWSGACTGKGPCVVIMDAAKTVTARFARALGPPVPLAPSNLTATATSQQDVLLTWHDNSTNEDTFRVEMRRGQQAFREVATVGADVTSVMIPNLRSDTRYFFRIRARNTFGFSTYSNGAFVKTPR